MVSGLDLHYRHDKEESSWRRIHIPYAAKILLTNLFLVLEPSRLSRYLAKRKSKKLVFAWLMEFTSFSV